MRYLIALWLVGCAAAPAPRPSPTASPPVTIVITPSPAAIAPGLAKYPGYRESVYVQDPGRADSDSLARGYNLYQHDCAPCHGRNLDGDLGPAQPAAADLRLASSYKLGLTDQALYRTIRYGIPGTAMGRNSLSKEQVFDLIHLLRSRIHADGGSGAGPVP